MPLYEFRCGECGGERDVRTSFEEADDLELVCFGCGAGMRRVMSTRISVVLPSTSSTSAAAPTTSRSRSSRRPGQVCSDGAVNLTRPNPFRKELPGGPAGGATPAPGRRS